MISPLEMTLFLLLASVAGVVVFRFLNLPPMLGYLTVGILVGPNALGLVPDSVGAQNLAEFGVVFLMFSIGLEFSLAKLRSMRRLVFGLGLLQVLGTIVVAVVARFRVRALGTYQVAGEHRARRRARDVVDGHCQQDARGAPRDRDRARPQYLRRAAVSGSRGGAAPHHHFGARRRFERPRSNALGIAAIKIVVALSLLLIVGQKFMTRWFNVVARRRSQELFILNLLLVTLGAAFITDKFGLSLALGAFIAGMLIAETPYRHQVEEDIKPFRDVLLGLFFVHDRHAAESARDLGASADRARLPDRADPC